ncbi:MAG: hypothetical protein Q8N26_07455 [Myxococcales bacterium]|nr:hypothetical protein [Myxococcales bacterium]
MRVTRPEMSRVSVVLVASGWTMDDTCESRVQEYDSLPTPATMGGA